MENNKDQAFDVIVLAGQSNAEGNGIKKDKTEFLSDDVYQVIDKNYIGLKTLDDGKVIIEMVYPTEIVFEKAHERSDGKGGSLADFSETFAKRYIEDGRLINGRKILIVKTAVGGTGFARNEWGIGSPLYERLRYMLDYALGLNKKNRVVALLWHQGECDAFENAQFSNAERFDFYYKNFVAQTEDFRKKYGENIPVIAGEFIDSWAELPENKNNCDVVESALYSATGDMGNAKTVSSKGLISNDEAFHNGDNVHFCAESLYELGKRYYSAFSEIVKGGKKANDNLA